MLSFDLKRRRLLMSAFGQCSRVRPAALLGVLVTVAVLGTVIIGCGRSDQAADQMPAEVSNAPESELSETVPRAINESEVLSEQNPSTATNEVAVQTEELGREPVSDAEIQSVKVDYLEKAAWQDAGLESISSIVETYYWAIREGRLDRYADCLCTAERELFLRTQRESQSGFKASVAGMQGYQIESVVRTNGLTVVVVKHSDIRRGTVYDFVAVAREAKKLRIEGTKGFLTYRAHGDIPIALVMGYKSRMDGRAGGKFGDR
jgi:hypothetical protein